MKELIFIRDYKDKSILLTWNKYPEKGKSYYEHKIELCEELKKLVSLLTKDEKTCMQLRAGRDCFLFLSTLPEIGLTVTPCADVSKKDCEIFYV